MTGLQPRPRKAATMLHLCLISQLIYQICTPMYVLGQTYVTGSLSFVGSVPSDGSFTRAATSTNHNIIRLASAATNYTLQATWTSSSSLSLSSVSYAWPSEYDLSAAAYFSAPTCSSFGVTINSAGAGLYNYVVWCSIPGNTTHGRNLPLTAAFNNGYDRVSTTEYFEYAPPGVSSSVLTSDTLVTTDGYGFAAHCSGGGITTLAYTTFNYPTPANYTFVVPQDRFQWLKLTGVTGIPTGSPYYGASTDQGKLVWFALALPDATVVDGNVGAVFSGLSPLAATPVSVGGCLPGATEAFSYSNVLGEFHFPTPYFSQIPSLVQQHGYIYKLVMVVGISNSVSPGVSPVWTYPTPWTIAFQPPPRIDYVVGCQTTAAQQTRNVKGCRTQGGESITLYGAYFFKTSQLPLSVSVNGAAVNITNTSSTGSYVIFQTPASVGLYRLITSTSYDQTTSATDPYSTISYAPPTITHIQSAACYFDTTKAGCAVSVPTACLQLTNCTRRTNKQYTLTIQGTNFGSGSVTESATVFVGSLACTNVTHDPTTPQTKLTCILPDGSDINLPVIVIQSDAASSTVVSLDYSQCLAGTHKNGLNCDTCADGTYTTVAAQAQCTTATPGTYATADHTNSQPCGVGTYQNSTGASACVPCPLGRWTNSIGQVICQQADVGYKATVPTQQDPCPAGTAQPKPGQSTCSPCAKGTYTITPAQIKCLDADQGYYSDNSTRQTACPAGTYQNITAQSTCRPCPSGWYSSSSGQVICKAAEQGRFVDPHDATQSKPCTSGTYQPDTGMTSCSSCPNGTISQGEGQVACKEVQPGNYADDQGQEQPCVAGYYSDQSGQSQCQPCPVGSYTAATGQLTCQSAEAGKYVDVQGATSSSPCPHGTYQPSTKSSSCLLCLPGKSNPQLGQTQCVDCAAGRYANMNGTSDCLPCPTGAYSDNKGASVCQTCAVGTFQDTTGQTVCTQCDAGGQQQYVVTDRVTGLHSCQDCPTGARCSGGLVIGTADVWLAAQTDSTVQAFTCQSGRCEVCDVSSDGTILYDSGSPTTNGTNSTTSSSSTLIRQCCSANRESADVNPLCGRCLSGYQEWGGSCVACTSTNVGVLIGLIIASWVYVAAFIFICQSNDGLVKIFMYFAATAYLLIGPDVDRLSWISFFQFGIFSSGASTCVAAISSSDKLILSLVSPLIAIAQLLVMMMAYVGYRVCQYKHDVRAAHQHAQQDQQAEITIKWRWGIRPFVRTLIALLLFSFTQTASTVAKFLACQRVTYYGKTDSYIITSPSTSCTSSEYKMLLPIFIAVGSVLVIVLPLLIFATLYVFRERLHEPRMMAVLGVVYETYRPQHYLYEAAVLLRRAIVVSISVSLVNDEVQMYTIISLINIAILAVHVAVQPFLTTIENVMESVSLFCLTAISMILIPNTSTISPGYTVLLFLLVMGTGVSLCAIIIYQKWLALQAYRAGRNTNTQQHPKHTIEMKGTGSVLSHKSMAPLPAAASSRQLNDPDVDVDVDPHPNPLSDTRSPASLSTPTPATAAAPATLATYIPSVRRVLPQQPGRTRSTENLFAEREYVLEDFDSPATDRSHVSGSGIGLLPMNRNISAPSTLSSQTGTRTSIPEVDQV